MTTKKKGIEIPVFDDRDLYDIFPKKTTIDKEKIVREKGYLYFIGKDGYVWAAPMKHNKTGKKKKVGTVKHERPKKRVEPNFNNEGFVIKVKMKNA